MTVLLVFTTGQSDVQLAQGGRRVGLASPRAALLHDDICARGYTFAPAPIDRGPQIEHLPAGPVTVCTPKLDAVWSHLVEHGEKPTHVLFLESARMPESTPHDPRRAGEILAARIGALSPETSVERVAYLTGDERLEDPGDPYGQLIRPEVVARLDTAVAGAVHRYSHHRVVVSATGGFKEVAALVEAIARLHAIDSAIETVKVSDSYGTDAAVSLSEMPEPAESYRARRSALDLINQGQLRAAWGSIQRVAADARENYWTNVVEWLALFESAMPVPAECDLAVLVHPRAAVQAVVRAEFALLANDIPRAVQSTLDFLESALMDSKCEDSVDKGRSPALAQLAAAAGRVHRLRSELSRSVPTEALMEHAAVLMSDAGLWSAATPRSILTQDTVRRLLEECAVHSAATLAMDVLAEARDRLLSTPEVYP